MIKLNKYTIPKSKEFELELRDDNNVIEVEKYYLLYGRDKETNDIILHVIEDDINDKHINKFKFIKAGEDIEEDEHWMYIGRLGDEFLFQNSSWER